MSGDIGIGRLLDGEAERDRQGLPLKGCVNGSR